MTFDENYLGHKLVKNAYKLNRYYCDKCKSTVLFDVDSNSYHYLTDTTTVNLYEQLNITCDEMIIKGIIE